LWDEGFLLLRDWIIKFHRSCYRRVHSLNKRLGSLTKEMQRWKHNAM
jgi:hypothetical protein